VRTLCVILKDDYGDPAKGESYEHRYFYGTLCKLTQCMMFDFGAYLVPERQADLQADLIRVVDEWGPDLVFFTLYQDQILPETIAAITKRTKTVNWFCDDQWRFDWSVRYAPSFTKVVTTDPMAVERYASAGVENVILSQWGADIPENINEYVPRGTTFVGMANAYRVWVVKMLEARGINVECFGTGWPNGRVSYDRMMSIFRYSDINLNLPNSRCLDERFIASFPGHEAVLRGWGKVRDQVKGRHFEIAAAGGFQLCPYVDFLEEYLIPGREVACYESVDGLAEKIRYYLERPRLRMIIGNSGQIRVGLDHTYEKRFTELLEEVGCPVDGMKSKAGSTSTTSTTAQ